MITRAESRRTAAVLAFVPVCVAVCTAVGWAQNFHAISASTASIAINSGDLKSRTSAKKLPDIGSSGSDSNVGNRLEIRQGGRLLRQVVSLSGGFVPTATVQTGNFLSGDKVQSSVPSTSSPRTSSVPNAGTNRETSRQTIEYYELSPLRDAHLRDTAILGPEGDTAVGVGAQGDGAQGDTAVRSTSDPGIDSASKLLLEIKKSTISRILKSSATPDPGIRAERVALVQETPKSGSEEWVDLAIPSEVFNAANQKPRTGQHGTVPAVNSARPGQELTGESLGAGGSKSQSDLGALNETLQKAAKPEQLKLQPSMESQHSGTALIPESSEGSKGKGSSKGEPKPTSDNILSPDQAIPVWILQQGGQDVDFRSHAAEPEYQSEKSSSSGVRSEIFSPQVPSEKSSNEQLPIGQSNRFSDSLQTMETPHELELVPPAESSEGSPNEPQPDSPTQGPRAEDKSSDSTAKGSDTHFPMLTLGEAHPAHFDALAQKTAFFESDFSPPGGPSGSTFDPLAASLVYRGKFQVPVQRPLIELWRPLYTSGIYPPALTWFGATNPMKPHFLVYGDMRTAFGANRNAAGSSNLWGNVLNLDMDLQLTSTERVHAFVAPLNRGTQATGLSFDDEVDFVDGTNFNLLTLFFEGDLGALAGGAMGDFPPFDFPFSFGLIPLIYQNGIWANDAVLGAAVALPARHSRFLKWSNFDASLFWATDNVTTDAFPGQDSAADFFGTAWFIDAYEGYIEADYAFVNDNTGSGRGYHNIAMAFTRRYFARVSNSIRFIVNTGQENLAKVDRTADGHLLLIENSFISPYPNTVVPYVNLFYGQGRPQSLARVGQAGGILNNTGINFETDGITGYPTLDATGRNTFGLAAGINLLGSQFAHQLILEAAMLKALGPANLRNAEGDQYAIGLRYQKPLSHNLIFRTDHMVGFRESASDLNGSRFEFRWKF